MRRPTLLATVEALGLLVWLVLAGVLVWREREQGDLVPIDPEALSTGPSEESWMGVYFQGQKVGYAVTSEAPTADGGRLLRSRSSFSMVAFGQIKEVVTIGNAVVDNDGNLRRFDFFMSSDPVRLSARGEVHAKEIRIEVTQAGEVKPMVLPIERPPQMSATLPAWVRTLGTLTPGQEFEVPYFDMVTMQQAPMTVRVGSVEILPGGEEAYWLERKVGDIESRVLMTPAGQVIREEGALGMSLVRQTREEAMAMPTGVEPVDIISLSAVKLAGIIPDPRGVIALDMRVTGVEPGRIRHDPPNQVVEGDVVRLRARLEAEIPADLPREDRTRTEDLAATLTLQVDHADIRARSTQWIGDIPTRRDAAKTLVQRVYEYLRKEPTIGVPNALEVLQTGQGDCNEHTALYVALARAAGIPARIAAGVVYTDRIGDGAFYYHAWPEVWFGESTGWVPVDPTFGQFPADATHVKLVDGDLEKQVEIMGVMGKLGFELLDAR